MVRNALTVARWELRRTVGRRGFVIFTALVPALLLIAVLVISVFGERIGGAIAEATQPSPTTRYGLIDRSGVLAGLAGDPRLVPYDDEAAVRRDVEAETLEGYFVVPADYLSTGRVRYVARELGLFGQGGDDARPVIRGALLSALLGPGVEPEIAARIQWPVDLQAEELSGRSGSTASTIINYLVPYVMALLFVMAIFVTSGYLLQGVSEEKENRVIEIVLSAVTPDELLLGKILGQATAGLAQVLVWLVSGVALAPILLGRFVDLADLQFNFAVLPLSVAYFLLGYFLVASIYAGVGAIAPTSREGQQIAGYAAIIVVVPLILNQLVISSPDGTLSVVLSLIPPTAPSAALLRLSAGSTDVVSFAISLALLALSVPLAVWLSTRVFRIGLLVYGRRLRLRDIARAVRG